MNKESVVEAPLEPSAKQILLMKGSSTSQVMNDVLLDLTLLSKPNVKLLQRKNDILPFEDANSLEFLATKNKCSVFGLVSNTKKRPNNLIMGRLFDGHLLDMFEFGVDNNKTSMSDIVGDKKGIGSKPCLIFTGDQWERDSLYKNIQNMMIDFFRGDKITKFSFKGIDHVISFTCVDGKIYLRTYFIKYNKSESKVPTISFSEMGPNYDLTVRRSQLPSGDMWKAACQKDKRKLPAKVKNIKKTSLGDKVGRIHMKKQNLDARGGKLVSALRNNKKRTSTDNSSEQKIIKKKIKSS